MKLLKKLYEISSPSGNEQVMRKFIKSLLLGMGIDYSEDKYGNIYATKGESETYPCIVCHTDEVHKARSNGYRVIETDGIIFGMNVNGMSFEGIGADDKNGIWICLRALNDFDVMKCAFFVSEEIGCVGSSRADMKFFDDCRFVLQCDRKGNNDFIIEAGGTELCSSEFVEAVGIHNFGYEVAYGLMTDVMTLKERGLSVCACNISCGYYNPHSSNEITRINDLYNCYNLVKHIVSECTSVFPHEYVWEELMYSGYSHNKRKNGIDSWWDSEENEVTVYCDEYSQMLEDMYEYSCQADHFSLQAFMDMYSEFYPSLGRIDFEYACEEIMGCIVN